MTTPDSNFRSEFPEGAAHVAPSGVPLSEQTEDRLEAALLAEATRHGFRLAVRCRACRHWVSNPKSVAVHLGPRCRARLRAAQAEADRAEQNGGDQ